MTQFGSQDRLGPQAVAFGHEIVGEVAEKAVAVEGLRGQRRVGVWCARRVPAQTASSPVRHTGYRAAMTTFATMVALEISSGSSGTDDGWSLLAVHAG